jgi:hypothetical protein
MKLKDRIQIDSAEDSYSDDDDLTDVLTGSGEKNNLKVKALVHQVIKKWSNKTTR